MRGLFSYRESWNCVLCWGENPRGLSHLSFHLLGLLLSLLSLSAAAGGGQLGGNDAVFPFC